MRALLAPLKRRDKVFLTGNGLAIPAFGAFVLYILCNCRRVDQDTSEEAWAADADDYQGDDDDFDILAASQQAGDAEGLEGSHASTSNN